MSLTSRRSNQRFDFHLLPLSLHLFRFSTISMPIVKSRQVAVIIANAPRPAPQASNRASKNSAPKQNLSRQVPSQATQKFGLQQNQQKVATRSAPSTQNQHSHVQKPRQQQAPSKWPQQDVRQRNAKQRGPPPKMTSGSENLGERLWRQREPAQAHIRIPIELASQDKGYTMIAKHHRTFVLHDGKPGGRGSTEFGIWGDPKAVEATVQDIRAWIEDWQSSRKSNKSSKFSKVCSLTPILQDRAERHWEKEVKKHRFRQFPPPDKAFEAIGSFHWPMNEYKPEEILGSSYEALDPIRMDCKCYVVFDEEQGLFRVMGRSDAVRTGLMRLRGTYFQVAARQITPLELHLLHDADGDRSGKSIVLKEYERIRIMSGEDSGRAKTGTFASDGRRRLRGFNCKRRRCVSLGDFEAEQVALLPWQHTNENTARYIPCHAIHENSERRLHD